MESLLESVEVLELLDPSAHYSKFVSRDVRPSGRPFHLSRPITLSPTILTRNAAGSCLASIGETRILAAATLTVGKPSPSHPRWGEIEVSLHVGPLCHSKYDASGRSSGFRDARALESWMWRTLVMSSGVVDLEDLCIRERESAWKVHVSLLVVNNDGNLEDVGILGILGALADLKLPEVVVLENGEVRVCPEEDKKTRLVLKSIMVPLSMGIFEDKLIVDPTAREEEVMSGVLNLVVDENGNLINVNKIGGRSLEKDEMNACVALAKERVTELVPMITSFQNIERK